MLASKKWQDGDLTHQVLTNPSSYIGKIVSIRGTMNGSVVIEDGLSRFNISTGTRPGEGPRDGDVLHVLVNMSDASLAKAVATIMISRNDDLMVSAKGELILAKVTNIDEKQNIMMIASEISLAPKEDYWDGLVDLVGNPVKISGRVSNAAGKVFYITDDRYEPHTPVYGTVPNGVQCRMTDECAADVAKRQTLSKLLRSEGNSVEVSGTVERLYGKSVFISVQKIKKV